MFYLQMFLILVWGVVASGVGLIVCILRWGNLDLSRFMGRIYSFGILPICGIKVVHEGTEHLEAYQPCIYAVNHQSNFDLVSLGTIVPHQMVTIGKKELRWIPFFGIVFMACGNVCLDRNNRTKAIAGLGAAIKAIKVRKASIWIFPEGTRNRTGQGLLPFKKGAFYMAINAQVPVVPIVSAPLRPLIDFPNRKITSGVLKIRVLPPISTTGLKPEDVEKLMAQVRETMLQALQSVS